VETKQINGLKLLLSHRIIGKFKEIPPIGSGLMWQVKIGVSDLGWKATCPNRSSFESDLGL